LDFGYDSHCDVVALDLVCDGKGYPLSTLWYLLFSL
jgi:hypothetical protein